MSQEELEFLEWLVKMNERITLVLLKIKDRMDISEDDYEILKLWHRDWFLGLHPMYKTQMKGSNENVNQIGLFADNEL